MLFLKFYLKRFSLLLIIGLAGWVFVNYYSYIFSRKVVGVVVDVKQIDTNVALMQVTGATQDRLNPALYSAYSVAIKETSGEIVTSSAEDRQWAVVHPGNCAEAIYYPYPPWRLDKGNTYFNARLEKLTECK